MLTLGKLGKGYMSLAMAGVAQWIGALSVHLKIAGSIAGQSTYGRQPIETHIKNRSSKYTYPQLRI